MDGRLALPLLDLEAAAFELGMQLARLALPPRALEVPLRGDAVHTAIVLERCEPQLAVEAVVAREERREVVGVDRAAHELESVVE